MSKERQIYAQLRPSNHDPDVFIIEETDQNLGELTFKWNYLESYWEVKNYRIDETRFVPVGKTLFKIMAEYVRKHGLGYRIGLNTDKDEYTRSELIGKSYFRNVVNTFEVIHITEAKELDGISLVEALKGAGIGIDCISISPVGKPGELLYWQGFPVSADIYGYVCNASG